MKTPLAILTILAFTFAWAGENSSPAMAATVVKGEILEVKDVDNYTYLRLKTKDGETWAAVGKAQLKEGAEVTIENAMVMSNFESKSLKQTFKTIVFGNLAGATGSAAGSPAMDMATAHSGAAKAADVGDIRVPKATGANARTVAEIVTKSAELKNKPVVIRAKVVKFNAGIMGKNWLHVRDGSGSASDNTNDLLVTTADSAKVGDVVTVSGAVHTDRDFGSGYSYKVIVEDSTLRQ
jgi:hypothetical protein